MTMIILFEGIPTSGKSMVMRKMVPLLEKEGKKVEIISEREVNSLFLKKKDIKDASPAQGAPAHLKALLQAKLKNKPDFILAHNFHFFYLTTNCSRGKKETLSKEYKEIEDILESNLSLVVYLGIKGRYVLPSFRNTIKLYKDHGKNHPLEKILEAKGNGLQQLAYYQQKQEMYEKALHESRVTGLKIEIAKETNFDDVVGEVMAKIKNLQGFFALSFLEDNNPR